MLTIKEIIKYALAEDAPEGDISSMYLFTNEISEGKFIVKASGILSGMSLCKEIFKEVDPEIEFHILKDDGSSVLPKDIIALVKGKTSSILRAERIGLNFMQRMSGIATLTNEFVKATAGTNTQILDTRKTTPLLRELEKRAVKDGGGTNHRMSLSDMVMLKDNHLKAALSLTNAVDKVKTHIKPEIKIEVEVETIEMFKEALASKADIIMLDNMSNEMMRECVLLNAGKKKIEASGNMTLARIPSVAATGVDYISVGALTHSYQSLDISLKF